MKDTITCTVKGLTFQYFRRDCGDLITIKGKPGFVFSRDGSDPIDAGKPTGVFHGTFRDCREGEDYSPYGVFEETLLPDVQPEDYRGPLGLASIPVA